MTPSLLAASTEILLNQSDTSIVDAPIMATQRLQTQESRRPVAKILVNLRKVKQKFLSLIIELYIESEGETPYQTRRTEGNALIPFPILSTNPPILITPTNSPSSSPLARPPLYLSFSNTLSIM